MQKDKINSIVEAYKSMYDEDVLSENILSKLPGAHGRYMKKLKAAHDHHMNMHKGHISMENKLDPSRGRKDPGEGGNPDYDEDRKYNHSVASNVHDDAAGSIKKLAVHAKKNKLGGHPTDDVGKKLHNTAKSDSAAAHKHSHNAIKYDNNHADKAPGDHSDHLDHTKKLAKHVTYKSDSAHKHL